MSKKDGFIPNTFKRLNIDQKMIGILVTFAILGIFLVISMIIATHSLSGLRGYATFQTNWTEARKEATFQLFNYVKSQDDRYIARFDSALNLIHAAKEIRSNLLEDEVDLNTVRPLFLQFHTNPEDVDDMINTFTRFHTFSDFQKAINEWVKSDELISSMEGLAAEIETQINENSFPEAQQNQYAAQILKLDQDLTEAKFRLADALGSGTRFVNFIMLWVSISLGFILLLTGVLLSFRFMKSLKQWRREIEISEQQYRSLYEQNPNAVFSLSREGEFTNVNKVLERVLEHSLEELKGIKFDQFIKKTELTKVEEYFHKTLKGEPQYYETIAVLENGDLIYIEVTNLPIVVDGDITGVYGIVRNITYRKNAEQKIQEQLEEKNHLLAEVHDRVKNNLALISSLIQLQQEVSGTAKMENYLESTISRIHSLAMVHERLYHNETFSSIQIDGYVNELAETVQKKYSPNLKKNQLLIDTEPVTLSIKQSIPVGLLLNELLINAFKYGRNNGTGKIEVSLYQKEDKVVLNVSDEGPGLPEGISLNSPKTLGMNLISVLIKQLRATHQLTTENGTSITISFRTHGKISKIA